MRNLVKDLAGRVIGVLSAATATVAVLGMFVTPAQAVPSFAVQTGQPCQACHVGGFGPQMTAFGRSFKMHGYTQRGGGDFNLPISAMAVASWVQTGKNQPAPPADGFKRNDNLGLDQVSIFIAGGLGTHFGGFIQNTYDGIGDGWSWDNLDLRAVTSLDLKAHDIVVGLSLNNSPTVQDAWNTLPAWGYPYTSSGLAPGAATAPLLAGGLAQNVLGLTGYAWIDDHIFVEAGSYQSVGAGPLRRMGADPYAPGDIRGTAPYARIAFTQPMFGGTLMTGAFGMKADINPARDRSTNATDHYTDVGVDAGFERTLASGDVITINARYTHEKQNLDATCTLINDQAMSTASAGDGPVTVSGGASGLCSPGASLDDMQVNASYFWRNKIGATVQLFDMSGSTNETLYAGNRTFKPDSSGVTLQLDATPWGAGGSPFGPRFNVRVGAQYTAYNKFNGAHSNWDNGGANASDNNTLRTFLWIAY